VLFSKKANLGAGSFVFLFIGRDGSAFAEAQVYLVRGEGGVDREYRTRIS